MKYQLNLIKKEIGIDLSNKPRKLAHCKEAANTVKTHLAARDCYNFPFAIDNITNDQDYENMISRDEFE